MEQLIVGRYGEIGLKGANRGVFERALLREVQRRLPAGGRAELRGGQLVVRVPPEAATAAAEELTRVFGLVAVVEAVAVPLDVEAVTAAAVDLGRRAAAQGARSFKIAARRAFKGFPLTSPQLNARLGAAVAAATGLAVDVHQPDLVLSVEVRAEAVYLHGPALAGPGGLPVGTSGRAVLLLSGGIDSPVAGYLAAKRGLRTAAVYFHAFPFTGDRTKEKVIDLCRALSRYLGPVRLWVVPFTPVQLAIRDRCPEAYATLITRRMMLRVAEGICRRERAGALVTGDSLGQVASQTLEALAAVGEVAELPLLRPLVGLDKEEIIALARRIGTYEISIRPYEDCCSVFAPRHPRTRPARADVRAAEAPLPVAELVAEALAGAERIVIPGPGPAAGG
jgi:thiamine biosynthesis protein ThiI